MDRYIISLTTWLSQPVGFLATCFCVITGLTAGTLLSFNDHWALVFNLFLSIGALLLAALILVASAKDTAAIQVKLDELLRAVDEADDRLIGIDQKSSVEVEAVRDVASTPLGRP